jgi:signal transduction histidine kinase
MCGLCLGGLVRAAEPTAWTCADVRSLTREQAAEHRPVVVRGVVTFVENGRSLVIQDDSAGLYITARAQRFTPDTLRLMQAGTQVEVTGTSVPGGFAPIVCADSVRVLGQAPLPPAQEVQLADLDSGRFDCLRVSLSGVVQQARFGGAPELNLRLEIATSTGGFSAFIKNPGNLGASRLVDAEVQATGVCYTLSNPRGELLGNLLWLADATELSQLQPARTDPFTAPEVAPLALNPYRPQGPNHHRQRLKGTVTLSRSGDFFYVEMAQRGIRVNTRSPERVMPGDQVEAVGFVKQTADFAILNDAEFRILGKSLLPEPLAFTRGEILALRSTDTNAVLRQEDYDGKRVRMRGQVITLESHVGKDHQLLLHSYGGIVVATLPASITGAELTELVPGSDVEATGICALTLYENWPARVLPTAKDFTLILQDKASLRILSRPSWWTTQRLLWALTATAILLVSALGLVVLLRRRIAQRTAELAAEMRTRQEKERALLDAEVEFRATHQERERLAADLHDTIEQSLTGIAMQLDASKRAPTPEHAGRNLALASQMLARSREDVRRSVWNLRARALDDQFLREAVRHIVAATLDGTAIELNVGGSGEEEVIPDFIAGNLLMVAKESITNALKHAAPTRVDINVDYTPATVTLTVSDNGCGFTPIKAQGPHEGHFGLTGMRERAERLSGRIELSSVLGKGTCITLTVPLHEHSDVK